MMNTIMDENLVPSDLIRSGSVAEKLAWIDREIQTLHHFCLTAGHDPHDICTFAEPLWKLTGKSARKGLSCRTYSITLIVGLIAALSALLYYDPLYRVACTYGRLTTFKVNQYTRVTNFCRSSQNMGYMNTGVGSLRKCDASVFFVVFSFHCHMDRGGGRGLSNWQSAYWHAT